MVRRFHAAGIEVLLDVVYNHTAEGSEMGPTLGFRGIDNAAYYRLLPENPRYHINDTGCGNTLNTSHPRVLQMILDSLRYWVEVMHVDGFRFDLAATLARERSEEHTSELQSLMRISYAVFCLKKKTTNTTTTNTKQQLYNTHKQ